MENKVKHTKEPWLIIEHPKWNNTYYRIDDKIDARWGSFGEIAYADKVNAERIVACVNACKGISNEALKYGVVEWGVNMTSDVTNEDFRLGDEKIKIWEK